MPRYYLPPPPGYMYIFTKYITRNGRRIWAEAHGLKAFRILVRVR